MVLLEAERDGGTRLRRRGRRLSRGLTWLKALLSVSLFSLLLARASPFLSVLPRRSVAWPRAAFNRAPVDYLDVESRVSLQTTGKLRTFVRHSIPRASGAPFHELAIRASVSASSL